MDSKSVNTLTRQAVAQLHLSGLILSALVERKLLSAEEARLLVADAQAKLDAGNLFEPVFAMLQNEFRG